MKVEAILYCTLLAHSNDHLLGSTPTHRHTAAAAMASIHASITNGQGLPPRPEGSHHAPQCLGGWSMDHARTVTDAKAPMASSVAHHLSIWMII